MDTIKSLKKTKTAFIPKNECVACGCCIKACPRNTISMIKGKFAQVYTDACIGCGLCQKACPASIIELTEVEIHE